MAVSNSYRTTGSGAPSATARRTADLIVTFLAPSAGRIKAIHSRGIIHIVYTTDDHDSFLQRVSQLMDQCFFSQRLRSGQTDPGGEVLLLKHTATGLPVNLHAAL